MRIALALLLLAPGCTTTYRVHRLDGAEQLIRDAIIQSRTRDVDIKAVGRTLVADFGRRTAWKATLEVWTELTGGAPLYHASDRAWAESRGHQVQCAAWLVTYKTYWLE
jgi:hypothetical protein